jgi:uncharacterized membrane protein
MEIIPLICCAVIIYCIYKYFGGATSSNNSNSKDNLLEGEMSIQKVNSTVLTNYRVIHQKEEKGNSTNIMLEQITSVDIIHKVYYSWLVMGIVSILIAIVLVNTAPQGYEGNNLRGIAGAIGILGIVFIIIFFFSNTNYVRVTVAGNAIWINLEGFSKQNLSKFVDNIEQAKVQRVEQLRKKDYVVPNINTFTSNNLSMDDKATPSVSNTVILLEKLNELKEKGIITVEEFQEQKKKVLDKL